MLFSLDIDTGKIESWTYSETGMLDASHFSEPQLIHWKSFDGRRMSAFKYLPPADKFSGKRPVMVNIHGRSGITNGDRTFSDGPTI